MGRLCLRIPHACVPWWLPSHTTFLSKQFFCVPSFAFLRSYVSNFASPSWFSILNRKLITYTVYTCLAPHPIVLHSTFPCYFTKFAFPFFRSAGTREQELVDAGFPPQLWVVSLPSLPSEDWLRREPASSQQICCTYIINNSASGNQSICRIYVLICMHRKYLHCLLETVIYAKYKKVPLIFMCFVPKIF